MTPPIEHLMKLFYNLNQYKSVTMVTNLEKGEFLIKIKYLNIIKVNQLFKHVPSELVEKYYNENKLKLIEHKKNTVIHFENEICKYVDIIIEGELIVQKIDEKGNVMTITQFRGGENLGENLLFSSNPVYPMSIISRSRTILLQVSKEVILDLCQSDKDFLLQFLNCISGKTAILTSKIQSISMKSIKESIIDFLNYEYRVQNNYKIKLNMSKKDFAERLGIQRTSLSRELTKMKNHGIIDFDPHTITIKDLNIIK
jgi:CRP/FNR family transcriptional regulator, dissimilatory nitrate respiration regulator